MYIDTRPSEDLANRWSGRGNVHTPPYPPYGEVFSAHSADGHSTQQKAERGCPTNTSESAQWGESSASTPRVLALRRAHRGRPWVGCACRNVRQIVSKRARSLGGGKELRRRRVVHDNHPADCYRAQCGGTPGASSVGTASGRRGREEMAMLKIHSYECKTLS